jgi:hypothetical protein
MRGQPAPVQQCEDVVNDVVLGLGEQVGFREGRFRNAGTGILAAEFGDDVVEVLLGAESLSFEYFHNGAARVGRESFTVEARFMVRNRPVTEHALSHHGLWLSSFPGLETLSNPVIIR